MHMHVYLANNTATIPAVQQQSPNTVIWGYDVCVICKYKKCLFVVVVVVVVTVVVVVVVVGVVVVVVAFCLS